MKERTAIKDRFKGKVAIFTGGSSGIGRAIVEELCKEGASVAFSGISDIGKTTDAEFVGSGFDVKFLKGDMFEESFCEALVNGTVEKWGKVNYLVNNALSFTAKGLDATREDWERVFMVGPVAYAKMVQMVVEPMKKQGGGSIVNMSSISQLAAQPNRWTYNSAKGAVYTLTRNMALDLAPFNIRVNSISPRWIWTREVEKAAGGDRAKWEPVRGQFHMLERSGEPVECAGPPLFLLSDDASFVTSVDLPPDANPRVRSGERWGRRPTPP